MNIQYEEETPKVPLRKRDKKKITTRQIKNDDEVSTTNEGSSWKKTLEDTTSKKTPVKEEKVPAKPVKAVRSKSKAQQKKSVKAGAKSDLIQSKLPSLIHMSNLFV